MLFEPEWRLKALSRSAGSIMACAASMACHAPLACATSMVARPAGWIKPKACNCATRCLLGALHALLGLRTAQKSLNFSAPILLGLLSIQSKQKHSSTSSS